MLPPHDGIEMGGASSRAVKSAPHEFPRSHPIPSSSRDASSSVEEVEQPIGCPLFMLRLRSNGSQRHPATCDEV